MTTQFSLTDGQVIRGYKDPVSHPVQGILIHDGYLLTTASGFPYDASPSFMRKWDMATGELIATAAVNDGLVFHLIYFDGGLWTSGGDRRIRFWGNWTTPKRSQSQSTLPSATPASPTSTSSTSPAVDKTNPETQTAPVDTATVGGLVVAGIACLILPAAAYIIYSKRKGITKNGETMSAANTVTTSSV